MSKSSRFRTPFGNQCVNWSQSLLKSPRHLFYTIVSLIWDKLSYKNFLFVRVEILGLFLNTITTDDRISRRNRDNFAQQIPMQLSQEPKFLSQISFVFLESKTNFVYFEKDEESHSLSLSEINDSERGGYSTV